MSKWYFTPRVENIESFLPAYLEKELMDPNSPEGHMIFKHNGDTMDVDLTTGMIEYTNSTPGETFKSKLNLRLNQWFMKGFINSDNGQTSDDIFHSRVAWHKS